MPHVQAHAPEGCPPCPLCPPCHAAHALCSPLVCPRCLLPRASWAACLVPSQVLGECVEPKMLVAGGCTRWGCSCSRELAVPGGIGGPSPPEHCEASQGGGSLPSRRLPGWCKCDQNARDSHSSPERRQFTARQQLVLMPRSQSNAPV